MIFYGALGIIQGMLFTYLSATLSTLEKRFGIKSKEAAYIMSGNEISQILFLFVMPVGDQGEKEAFMDNNWLVLFCTRMFPYGLATFSLSCRRSHPGIYQLI